MLQKAFDNYAEIYDEDFTHSPVGILQRRRVYKFLDRHLTASSAILEINCGTGEDVKYLSEKGHYVTGSDISERMIAVARKKNEKHIEFIVSDTKDILSIIGDKKFDIVFSNFGGLNCLPPAELKDCSRYFNSLLKENGKLIFVIMGRKCLWEKFYFTLKSDKRKNRRLAEAGVSSNISGENFKTYYYSPKEFSEIVKEQFNCVTKKPIGLFIPPSFMNSFFKNKKNALKLLNFFEKLFGDINSLANYGDHYFIVFKKK